MAGPVRQQPKQVWAKVWGSGDRCALLVWMRTAQLLKKAARERHQTLNVEFCVSTMPFLRDECPGETGAHIYTKQAFNIYGSIYSQKL